MKDSLKTRIKQDVVSAMREKRKEDLSILRMLTAAIKQKEVDDRKDVSDVDAIAIINKMVKQREDAKNQYIAAGREELAEKEHIEQEFLKKYLPEPLSDQELDDLISKAIADIKASSIKDMGKVMARIKELDDGRVNNAVAGKKVKAVLSKLN